MNQRQARRAAKYTLSVIIRQLQDVQDSNLDLFLAYYGVTNRQDMHRIKTEMGLISLELGNVQLPVGFSPPPIPLHH